MRLRDEVNHVMQGHGTHVASTAIGKSGFGVAPESQWMACRSIANDLGREKFPRLSQFLLGASMIWRKNPSSELRPHVIEIRTGGRVRGSSGRGRNRFGCTSAGISRSCRGFRWWEQQPLLWSIHSASPSPSGLQRNKGTLAMFSSWPLDYQFSISTIQLKSTKIPSIIKPDHFSSRSVENCRGDWSLLQLKMSGTSPGNSACSRA